jgi:hypothetical protein
VFEGINFLSRNAEMTEAETAAMHARAEKAGMYPCKYSQYSCIRLYFVVQHSFSCLSSVASIDGASPEQMHTVARRPVGAPAIDNSWQQMWRAIGVDKLLEVLTESIEDGGR